MKWFKNLFNNEKKVVETLLESNIQNIHKEHPSTSLLKGFEFALEQFSMRNEDLTAIIASLLLDKGSSEYTIPAEFLESTMNTGLIVKYHFDINGNLNVWTELPETETINEEGDE